MITTLWRGAVEPTWNQTWSRPLRERVVWGVVVGSAEIVAGVISVASLGQFASRLPLNAALHLTVRKHRGADERQDENDREP